MTVHAINGVFSGGGIKGIALAGAAAGSLEAGYRFDHAVGTSSGAMVASLVAAGYGADELAAGVSWVPWPDLLDWLPTSRIPLIGKAISMATNHAQCSGDRIEQIWGRLLAAKGVRTFGDLEPGSLRIVATDITHQRGIVLPDALPEYGIDPRTFSVARAVRMSTAVPFFFKPVPLRNPKTGDVGLIADGAMTANYPLRVARRSAVWPIVGFRFLDPEHHLHVRVRGPASLARAVITAGIRAADIIRSDTTSGAVTVALAVDRDPLDFGLSVAAARDLFDQGRSAAFTALSDPAPSIVAD
ncbi:MAG: patatin-like phospholipase family protein [Acidimicrobiia bacterium]|nr:patatin-like phospholipase family protein [Acidimicrobiia bacterium]